MARSKIRIIVLSVVGFTLLYAGLITATFLWPLGANLDWWERGFMLAGWLITMGGLLGFLDVQDEPHRVNRSQNGKPS